MNYESRVAKLEAVFDPPMKPQLVLAFADIDADGRYCKVRVSGKHDERDPAETATQFYRRAVAGHDASAQVIWISWSASEAIDALGEPITETGAEEIGGQLTDEEMDGAITTLRNMVDCLPVPGATSEVGP
jgi:hypothetical protein